MGVPQAIKRAGGSKEPLDFLWQSFINAERDGKARSLPPCCYYAPQLICHCRHITRVTAGGKHCRSGAGGCQRPRRWHEPDLES